MSELLNNKYAGGFGPLKLQRQQIIDSWHRSGILDGIVKDGLVSHGNDLLTIINLKSGLIIKKYCRDHCS